MAWRTIGSSLYYQRTYGDADGRVRSRYFGSGPLAEAAAASDARRRANRAERTKQTQTERNGIATNESLIIEYCKCIDQLFAASMQQNGWYKHRGQWRKK